MRNLIFAATIAAFSASSFAQDKIVLSNGDVLTGEIKTMADGKVIIASPVFGDVTVPMGNVQDMTTAAQIEIETAGGDRLVGRRIIGIENDALRLEGATNSLLLRDLSKINPPKQIDPSWTGSVQLNGLFATGNTDRRAVGGMLDASLRRAGDRTSFDAMFDYADNKDPATSEWVLNQRRVGSGLKYDYFLTKHAYVWVTGRVLGDTLADLQLRFTGGSGIGYTAIENENTTLLTELGLAYVNEDYRSSTPSTDYVSARVYYKLTHKLSDTAKIVHSAEAFPSVEDAGDVYAQVRTELQTSLTKSMIASLAHVLDYDNTPAPGRERQDHRFLLSIGWTF